MERRIKISSVVTTICFMLELLIGLFVGFNFFILVPLLATFTAMILCWILLLIVRSNNKDKDLFL